jgi:hypothetical protein
MSKRLAALLVLAGASLQGCVAAAIPVIAGSTMIGSRVTGRDAKGTAEAPRTPAPAAPAQVAAPGPAQAVTLPPEPAPVVADPAPQPAPMVTPPAPQPAPAPAPALAPAAATASASLVVASPATLPPASYPDPDRPIPAEQNSFARFVRYGYASARAAAEGQELPSAMLADPVALDGKRRRCAKGEQLVALIDLDPAGGQFVPPANPGEAPGLALGLALLREAGIEIAWISDLPTENSGLVRVALEKSGFDPRGEDIISLRRDENDSKEQRRNSLAGVACIIAIAGDERPDFDERFKYLRSPEAGVGIEPLIGDGWFLTEPLIGN